MSYLNNIRVFIRVFELGGLSAAGRDLRLSSAVVSNRIKDLESHLGVRLFNRTTRSLSPTEQGRAFYPGAQRILEAVDEAEATVVDLTTGQRGTVRIAAPLGLGRRMIAPLAAKLNDLYPKIELQLRLTDRKIDLTEEGLDAAFLLGVIEDSSLKLRSIADCPRVLCAAPSYLKRRGAPDSIDDLAKNHECLILRYPGANEFIWNLQNSEGFTPASVSGRLDSDDSDVLLDWALEGRGVVSKPLFEVAEHLTAGRLLRVLPNNPPPPARFACVYPHKRFQDPKVRLVIDYMIGNCRRRLDEMLAPVAAQLPR